MMHDTQQPREQTPAEREIHDRHSRLYREWLDARSRCHAEGDDDRANAAQVEADAIALALTTTPATCSWMIQHKLEVLRHAMTETAVAGSPPRFDELTMLAAIEVDLMEALPRSWRNTDD